MSNEGISLKLPIVRREKGGLTSEIAGQRVRLSNDGGRLEWLDASGTCSRTVELAATLGTSEGTVEISQGADPDPRLVICEQGPVRIVLRAQFDLLDQNAMRWGEGLTEWALYSDGSIAGSVSLRFINADRNTCLENAELRITGVGVSPQHLILEGSGFIRTDMPEALPFSATVSAVEVDGLCITWRTGASAAYVNGKGAWHGSGDDTPYYEDWGILPNQGWGDSGWGAGRGAGLYLDRVNDGLCLVFSRDAKGQPLSVVHALQGQLMMIPAANTDVAARVGDWQDPPSLELTGAEYRGYGIFDAAHMVYAPGASAWRVSVPPTKGTTAVHVYGLSHWGAWEVSCDGKTLLPQLINDGRGCDDPNGLQLGRFDDRHGPVIGRTDVPANRMILLIPAGDEPREVRGRAVEGLALSYLHWDDRQIYLLQSSANTARNLGELVVRDGKLRNLVAPHTRDVSIAAMPLYWYQCNTPTPYMATDDIQEYVLKKAGPDAIEFSVRSINRYGCANGVYHVRVSFDARFTRVDVDAELEVLKMWEFKDLQLLNMFTEEFRDHNRWPHEYALAANSTGQRMLKKPRQGRQVVEGSFFMDYTPPMLFVHYSAARGNVFLAQTRMDGPVTCQHFLCPHWIDSHYHVVNERGRLEPGDRVAGSYTMVIDDGRERNAEEIEVIAGKVMAGEDLADWLG